MSRLDKVNAEVKTGETILAHLRTALENTAHSAITTPWLRKVNAITLDKPRLIIGIVGATGSGKSSMINALLGEKQLIPTNCIRACTAVVTEISFNDQIQTPYRATIEFVSEAEWRKELELLLSDVEGAAGSIHDEESEAGIALSKIKAVYPCSTPQSLSKSDVDRLMGVKQVAELLGRKIEFQEASALALYNTMKKFIDSKDKTSNGQVVADAGIELWPMIRRVKIYTRAPILATGCVLVDLPGVADSNAARATVAKKYLQNCTALWVVAPIIRAVDDKSARHLLGEGFKRQMQRDGTLSRMTFVCSKTDEIILREARGILKQDDELAKKLEQIDRTKTRLDKDRTALLEAIASSRSEIESLDEKTRGALLEEKAYRGLKALAAKGAIVYPPLLETAAVTVPNKRQNSENDASPRTPKKIRTQEYLSQNYEPPLRTPASTLTPTSPSVSPFLARGTQESYRQDTSKPPLTPADVVTRLRELKEKRSKVRNDKTTLKAQKKEHTQALAELREVDKEIREQEWVACVLARNEYSSGLIRDDFVAGIQDLNRDEAEDDENFDPESEVQHNEALNQTLPVFCVSSQGFQKLRGNMEEEKVSACFSSEEETGIPALQNHAYKIGELQMIVAGEAYTDRVESLLTSLELWSSGNEAALIDDEESQKHEEVVNSMTTGLLDITKSTLSNIENEITTKVLDILSQAAKAGIEQAVLTALTWGAPRKSEEPGLAWATYRATVRRDGRFTNSKKEHNFNRDLAKPFMRKLDPKWNQVFNKTIYQIINDGITECKTKVDIFKNAFSDIMTANGMSSTVKLIFDDQLTRFVKFVDNVLHDVKMNTKTRQKAANRICEETILSEMTDIYKACEMERGRGSYVRMKTMMKLHLEDSSEEMFNEAQVKVRSTLEKMMEMIRDVAVCELKTACESFSRDCGYLISREGREFSSLDHEAQKGILEAISKAKTATDAGMKADTTQNAHREQPLPVRSATPVAGPAAVPIEPSQISIDMDWGEGEETESESESEGESDSFSELSDIQP